jgi:hypothetical protein
MTKRYLGNIVTANSTPPAGPYEDGVASGVWSLAEAFAYSKAGLWPTAGNALPVGLFSRDTYPAGAIEKINIPTTGNSTDFGSLGYRSGLSACSNSIKALFAFNDVTATSSIDAITFASGGNGTNFGSLGAYRKTSAGAGNTTRGIWAGGKAPSGTLYNFIDYVTFATTGDSTDFGDLTVSRFGAGSACSSTRSVFGGSNSNSGQSTIDYITTATTGNASDFGDLAFSPSANRIAASGVLSSSTRGIFAGMDKVDINYITMATTGNATDFGDLSITMGKGAQCSSPVRGVFMWGENSGGGAENIIDYVTIATTGNATDFGDMISTSANSTAGSNAHGGLS